jgi:DNA invertase Pin-like site-specific DNA recombinase
LSRKAIVYLRQSSDKQVRQNKESQPTGCGFRWESAGAAIVV